MFKTDYVVALKSPGLSASCAPVAVSLERGFAGLLPAPPVEGTRGSCSSRRPNNSKGRALWPGEDAGEGSRTQD